MIIIGCDFHTRYQQIAMANDETGELLLERRLDHQSGEAHAFYRSLQGAVRVGIGWRRMSAFNRGHDWVFASPEIRGKQPYWPENLLRRHIRPAARLCGINKRIGWHTFRHSYATHLKANGEDVKVVQESLRHANSRITLDTYTQALTPAKREAQSKVVRMILPEQTQTVAAGGGK